MNIINELTKFSKESPNKIAIINEKFAFTYKDINVISDNISDQIYHCIGSNKRVLIDLPHSISTIVAILSVLKSGNTYVPIEKNIVESKKRNILKQIQCEYVICDSPDDYYEYNCLVLSDNILHSYLMHQEYFSRVDFPEIPYILFTSGSTGSPKGVKISKKNLSYILDNMQKICPVDPYSVYCFSTPYTFDVSITEIFGWITGNGSVAVLDMHDLNKFKNLILLIDKYKISHFCASPSVLLTIFHMCSESDYKVVSNNIKYLMVAGERFDPNLSKIWKEKSLSCRLFNLYGPTEATVYATYHEVNSNDLTRKEIPIGVPLDNVRIEVWDKDEKGCGELIIYGDGVSSGYIENEDLTNKYFGETKTGKRYYRTGDIVYEQNNELIYLCRKDDQIQIHGIRVELGELEYYLSNEEEVNKSIVIFTDNKLIAFIQPQNSLFHLYEFGNKMRKKLPYYMQPNEYVILDSFPLSMSGKINRKKLKQDYDLKSTCTIKNTDDYILNEDEKIIANFFSSVLTIPYTELCKDSDFFEIGGDSLKAIKFLVLLESYYNRNFDVDFLYTYRTVKAIALHVRKNVSVTDSCNTCITDVTQDQKQQVIRYINVKESDKKIKEYPTHYVQRSYFYKKYDGFMSFISKYDNNFKLCEIENAIRSVISVHPLLRSVIVMSDSNLYFKEFEIDFEEHAIPFIELEDGELQDYINKMEIYLRSALFNARYNHKLLVLFCILKSPNTYTVYCAADHCVLDGASLNILRSNIGLALSKDLQIPEYSYQQFCREIHKNNAIDFVLNHKYTLFLQEIYKGKNRNYKLAAGTSLIYNEECNLIDSEEISIFASFIAAQKLAVKIHAQKIIVNAILNIRKFKHYDFTSTVGDMHTRVPLVYNENESLAQFSSNAKNIIENVYKKDFFCPRYAALSNYPELSVKQEIINAIYEENIDISFSFLGIQSDESFQIYKKSIGNMHKGLRKLSKHQIFITGIINRNRLYLYSDKHINKQ